MLCIDNGRYFQCDSVLKRIWQYNEKENVISEGEKKKDFVGKENVFWKVHHIIKWVMSNKLFSFLFFSAFVTKILNHFLKVFFRRLIKTSNLNKFRKIKIPLYYWLYHYLRWNKEFLAESPHYHCSQDLINQYCCSLVKSFEKFQIDFTLALHKPSWKSEKVLQTHTIT